MASNGDVSTDPVPVQDLPRGFEREIIATVGSFAVALFGIDREHKRIELSGSGTLVHVDKRHYILTAAHNWIEGLQNFPEIGMTLKEGEETRFTIERRKIKPTLLAPEGNGWNEWGPDLALLQIPPNLVGTVKACRSFYNLTKNRTLNCNDEDYLLWTFIGAAKVDETIHDSQPTEQISCYFAGPEKPQMREPLDYQDIKIKLSSPGLPATFKGVSGGGLWQVVLESASSEGTCLAKDWRLEGTVFYELRQDEYLTVRCHGRRSIEEITRKVLQG